MTNFGLRVLKSSSILFNLQKFKRPICINTARFQFYNRPTGYQLQSCLPSLFSPELSPQLLYCGCVVRSQNSLLQKGSTLYTLSSKRHCVTNTDHEKPPTKPSLYQRFKAMYRDYWYVLIPVHLVTSAGWFGGFYYMALSGFDIVAMLEWLHVTDKWIEPFRNGHAKAGYLAIAYALYKVATPLRYTVTLGGTTFSINYLTRLGLIKPVPSKERLKELYQDKKGQLLEKQQTIKDNMMQSLKTPEHN